MVYPFRIATHLQYYVKHEKCKVNDVIFPSGCEARAINLGNKNMKIGIFTGGTSVRSKNIFTDISRYPTGKHEIKQHYIYVHILFISRGCYCIDFVGTSLYLNDTIAVGKNLKLKKSEFLLTLYHTIPTLKETVFNNNVGKGEYSSNQDNAKPKPVYWRYQGKRCRH